MTLETFIKEARWSPNGPTAFDSASNYSGPDLSTYVQGPSRTRDSGVLDNSNFEVALEMLGGQSDTVEVHSFGHWACGWYEVILVDTSDVKAVQTLFEIHQALENYPVLDDNDYSQREQDEASETIDNNSSDFIRELIAACGVDKYSRAAARIEGHPEVHSIVASLYHEDGAYRGYEDAWVRSDDIARHIESISYEFKDSHFFQRIKALVLGRAA